MRSCLCEGPEICVARREVSCETVKSVPPSPETQQEVISSLCNLVENLGWYFVRSLGIARNGEGEEEEEERGEENDNGDLLYEGVDVVDASGRAATTGEAEGAIIEEEESEEGMDKGDEAVAGGVGRLSKERVKDCFPRCGCGEEKS